MSLRAETNGYADYHDSAHKLLSENREFYMAMSAMTRGGKVPTANEVRAALADGDLERAA